MGKRISSDIYLIGALGLVSFFYLLGCFFSYTPPQLFLISILLIYFSAPPAYVFHPKNILLTYYLVWYTFPVMYAPRYELYSFSDQAEIISYCMLIATYAIGYSIIHYYTRRCIPQNIGISNKYYVIKQFDRIPHSFYLNIFILLSILSCFITMIFSGYGIKGWLINPGQAFQERSGGGIGTILLIFFSGIVLTIAGYQIKRTWGVKKLYLFLFYTALISFYYVTLMHRSRLFVFILLIFLTNVFYLKMRLKYILIIGIIAIGSVGISTLLRGAIAEHQSIASFFLNYFDTYEALVYSVRYETPGILGTTFMAFRKLYLGMGYDPNMPYTISQLLTPKYFPGYGIRTTIQFPIETEMYLNGYYIFMLPFLFLYFYVVSKIYKHAFFTASLGGMYISMYVMILMISTLRGMFIDFTLFYNIPLLYFSYLLLNKYQKVCYSDFSSIRLQKS